MATDLCQRLPILQLTTTGAPINPAPQIIFLVISHKTRIYREEFILGFRVLSSPSSSYCRQWCAKDGLHLFQVSLLLEPY